MWRDVSVCAVYLVGGLYLTGHLWLGVRHRMLAGFPADQAQFEYWLVHAARVVTRGENPLFVSNLNVPVGVNMMANTSTYALTIPLVPVTVLLGPAVSFAVMVTVAPAATAAAWYWLFSRHVVASVPAAAVGGAFCGFAPGVVAQDNVHPNVAAQFLVPFILWSLVWLRVPGRTAGRGAVLGLLVVGQFFLNEEILFITALACLTFVVAWALQRPGRARRAAVRFLGGLAVAAVVAGVLLAYPIWYQFAGPQHYHGLSGIPGLFVTDIRALAAFPTYSLGGTRDSNRLAGDVVEQTSFFGWPLLLLCVVATAVFWRRPAVRAAAGTAVLFTALSLGARLTYDGRKLRMPGPWRLLGRLPLFDSVIVTRLALVAVPVAGLLLALLVQRILNHTAAANQRALRGITLAGVAAALVPLTPLPFPATERPAVPALVVSGQWRHYVPAGWTLFVVGNAPGEQDTTGMEYSSAQNNDIALPRGYFLGPDQTPDRHGAGRFGAPPRPTFTLLQHVTTSHRTATIGPADRDNAVADLRYWRTAAVMLVPQPDEQPLRATLADLLPAPPQQVGGVWLWDVRPLAR